MRGHHIYGRMLLALLAMTLAAPPALAAPKFTITQSDDRFSSDGLTTITSDGNRISKKSILGGTHIDNEGVFLNPTVILRRDTGEVVRLYLMLMNVSERLSVTSVQNLLGRPSRVSFITGEGDPIVVPIPDGEQEVSDPRCRGMVAGCTTPVLEHGLVPLTLEQYRRLMAASMLAVRIEGSERSRIYEAAEIAPTFIQNLRAFYSAHLARAAAGGIQQ